MSVIHLPPGRPERLVILNGLKKARNDAEALLKKQEPKPFELPVQPLWDKLTGKRQDVMGPIMSHAAEMASSMMLEQAIKNYTRQMIAIESDLDISMDLADYGCMVEWSEK